MSTERQKISFTSGDAECAAWHYPGANRGCVVMASGTAVTKELGTDAFAKRFNDAGFAVLAFDFRHLGESGGEPRQVVRIREQINDWQAAIGCAAGLPGVDPDRIAVWGFSLAGGEVLEVAARNPHLAGAIAQMPLADGRAVTPNALRHSTPWALLRLSGLAVLDALGSLVGRAPLLVPAAGKPGEVSALTTPDAMDGARALDPDGIHTDWQPMVAARSALLPGLYRPIRQASKIRGPLLAVVCEQDRSVLPDPGIRAARLAPRGELVLVPGTHYAPFLAAHEQAVEAELGFLRRHLLGEIPTDPASELRQGDRV
ncbi:alpha/beta hydrolase [Streptacidiphilus cavernicola]|uniref:Alpha/beta hydrolase n=1 Tax=Streptacidiphilus cavernicola TaxID=3342716 RepID=A0ABV6VPU7_9ACTN